MRGPRGGPPAHARPKQTYKPATSSSTTKSRGWGAKPTTGPSKAGKSWFPVNDYGPDWDKLRRQCLERDDYTCQDRSCRVVMRPPKHGGLDAHHVIPLPKGPNTLNNLKTLCKPCHAKAHIHLARMGYGTGKSKRP